MKDIENIVIGSKVRMTRRPFFRGRVMAIQPSLFGGSIEGAYCRWRFKPVGWVSRTLVSFSDLETIEEESGRRS